MTQSSKITQLYYHVHHAACDHAIFVLLEPMLLVFNIQGYVYFVMLKI